MTEKTPVLSSVEVVTTNIPGVHKFQFEHWLFDSVHVSVLCPGSRVDTLLCAAKCTPGAVLRFNAENVPALRGYLNKRPRLKQ